MEEQEQAPHIALPLKYRPMTFDDVVGQEHVVRTLRNAIASGRIANAYLFIGPRGIGKTTTSRILAKALNCTNPNGVEPCGACENCRQIAAGRSIDVTELDAASHNKVEDVKPIMDAVQFKPVASKYKIFIIDECHMLTGAAWNALLKTLEEPPPYVKFIFATTEGDKMLATIVSRCQRFDLRRIQTHQIAARLRYICGKEGIEADEDGSAAALWVQPQIIGEADKSGRPRPSKADLPEVRIPADIIVVAIGQGIEIQGFEQAGVPIKRGTFVAGLSGQVGDMDNLFAGGDCVTGPASAIRAIAAGKVAAANIDEHLGFHHEIKVDVDIPGPRLNNRAPHGRINTTEREACQRRCDFEDIECGLTEEGARTEASRCLRCDHYGYGIFRGGRNEKW